MIIIGRNTRGADPKESLLAEETFSVSTIFTNGQLSAFELNVPGVIGRYWDRYTVQFNAEEIAVLQGVVWAIEKRP